HPGRRVGVPAAELIEGLLVELAQRRRYPLEVGVGSSHLHASTRAPAALAQGAGSVPALQDPSPGAGAVGCRPAASAAPPPRGWWALVAGVHQVVEDLGDHLLRPSLAALVEPDAAGEGGERGVEQGLP